jgi:YD repeat-containing protein
VAFRVDGNGDPLQIAHIMVEPTQIGTAAIALKGGGGAAAGGEAVSYNPQDAADVLKAHFVDRSRLLGVDLKNGGLTSSAPVSLSVGNGDFPYKLSTNFTWSPIVPSVNSPNMPIVPTGPSSGWTSSWQNELSWSGSSAEAFAQSDVRAAVTTIAALYATQDIYASTPITSSGTELDIAASMAQAWWAHQMAFNVVTSTVGASTHHFLQSAPGRFFTPGGDFATLTITGAPAFIERKCGGDGQTPYAMSRGWDMSSVSFAVTGAHGDVQTFPYWHNKYSVNDISVCGWLEGFRLTQWAFPQGITVSLTYGQRYNSQRPADGIEQLIEVSNNIDRQIDFPNDGAGTITGATNGLTGTDARSIALSSSFITGIVTTTFTDQLSNASKSDYTFVARSDTQRPVAHPLLSDVFTADNLSQANVEYTYDALGRIKEVADAVDIQTGTRGPYEFYIGNGTRGERDDPLGQAYTVVYDIFGHPSHYIDEVGAETNTQFDARGRALQYLYPEGDCEALAYDDHNNTTDYWRVDTASSCNTGAGSSHVLHASAIWDQTWNKPLTVTNARGYTTTLAYYAGGNGASLPETATRPTIAEGSPVYNFTYDSKGRPLTAVVPFTSSQTVTSSNTYDSTYENLLTTTLDPGTGHVASTTSFSYDAQGDPITSTDPRGNVTSSIYDPARRKTEDDRHNGSLTAALNAADKTIYDAVGRDVEDDAGTVFSGTSVTTWIYTKKTTYTPVSKVATVTDADSRVTTNTYDNADRILTVSDPLSRQTHFVYCGITDTNCAANQVRIELRAWAGSNNNCQVSGTLQECYRTVGYFPDGEQKTIADANSNVTTFGYDAFVRLTTTIFPDSSTDYEQLTLDADGNVTAGRNRHNETLTYAYNALDWLTQKVSPNPSVTDNWTYKLNGAIASLTDTAGNAIVYGYDTAGRMTSEADTIAGLSGTKTSIYTLDANGNRTELAWPDGYDVNYYFDNLNRMTTAVDSGGTTLATNTWNPLSQRTNLAYSGTSGATIAAIYTNAGDLLTLNHTLAGAAPDYTFTYTNAHELLSEANTASNFVWQPPANASTTYVPNTLNQYASVGGVSYTYDQKGNLTSDGTFTYSYDAENRLLSARNAGLSESNCAD